jgi:hypothetical protein
VELILETVLNSFLVPRYTDDFYTHEYIDSDRDYTIQWLCSSGSFLFVNKNLSMHSNDESGRPGGKILCIRDAEKLRAPWLIGCRMMIFLNASGDICSALPSPELLCITYA